MTNLRTCLEEFLSYMNWDKNDIMESHLSMTFSKKCDDQVEISKLIGYNYKDIFDFFGDSFQVILSNNKSIQNPEIIKKNFDIENLHEYLEDTFKVYGYVDVELNIDKQKNSIWLHELKDVLEDYNFFHFMYTKNLVKWLEGHSFKELEGNITSLDKQTIFLVNDSDISLYNEKILISGNSININLINKFSDKFNLLEDKKIENWRYEQVNWIDGVKYLNPNWFYFDFTDIEIDESLKNYFLKTTVNLIIPSISNYVIAEGKQLFCTINGSKKLNIKIVDKNIYNQRQVYYLHEAFKWVYSGENTDKMSILRKLITMFLCEDCGNDYYSLLLTKSNDIYNTAIKNFDIYLQENVEQYFTERHRIKEMISNKSFELIKEINSIISTMNSNLLSIAGIILAAAVGYSNSLNLNIIKLAIIVYIIYILCVGTLNLYFHYTRYNVIKKDYDEHIKTFRKILIPRDIPDYKGGIMQKSVMNFWIYWSVYLISILSLSFCGIYILFNIEKIAEAIKMIPTQK